MPGADATADSRAQRPTESETEREAEPAVAEEPEEEPPLIDVMPDELALARGQLAGGLPTLAEGTLRRRIGWLEAEGVTTGDELDAARTLLAEALWRQQRPLAALAALEGVRQGSQQRRRPIAMLIEAEALVALGEPDRATGLLERVISAVGIDEAWRLRAGVPSRLTWPLPSELLPEPRRAERPPWSGTSESTDDADGGNIAERTASAHARMEAARGAYTVGEPGRGDEELSLAVRLDPALAGASVALIEPTLGEEPPSDRLLLYGDLLRAAGREREAQAAYDRAVGEHR